MDRQQETSKDSFTFSPFRGDREPLHDQSTPLRMNLTRPESASTSSLQEKLHRLKALAQDRKMRAEQGYTDNAVETLKAELGRKLPDRRRSIRGRSSTAVIEDAQLHLFKLEETRRFTSAAIIPQSEFPTFLARLPIFVPGRRRTQRNPLDSELSLPFSTPFGTGRKHGPPLDGNVFTTNRGRGESVGGWLHIEEQLRPVQDI